MSQKALKEVFEFRKRNPKFKKNPKDKEIEHTNNAAEIIFNLFKPQYKVMKQFQAPGGAQAHFSLFTLRHNFRAFPRGKRKGFSPIQIEALNVSLSDWSDLLYSEDKAILEEALFLSRGVKEVISQKKQPLDKRILLTINSEVRSLVRES